MDRLVAIAARVAIAYGYLLLLVRLSGKRTIREGTPFDLVVALIVSDFPDDMIWGEVPVSQGLVAIGTIMLLHLAVSVLSVHSPRFQQLVDSVPRLLLLDGRTLAKNMRQAHVSESDLDAMLRECEIQEHEDVKVGMLERSGRLSVERVPGAQPATRRELTD